MNVSVMYRESINSNFASSSFIPFATLKSIEGLALVPGLSHEVKACLAIATSPREYRRLQCLYAETAPAVSIETIESADTFWHRTQRNADGSPVRCRRNGRLKTWVKTLGAFRLPVKHGLKQCFYITAHNAQYWVIAPE